MNNKFLSVLRVGRKNIKIINKSSKYLKKNHKKKFIFIFLLVTAFFVFESINNDKTKKTNNFGFTYSGKNKKSSSGEPSKLRWSNPFKNIDNMKNI